MRERGREKERNEEKIADHRRKRERRKGEREKGTKRRNGKVRKCERAKERESK